MKYKELIIGAILSLLVTLVGITATYYINKPPNNENLDKLSYTVNQTTAFSSESQDLAITSVTFKNNGEKPAKQVFISINFKSAEIRDTTISSKTNIKYVKKTIEKNSIELNYDSLLPEEAITIELLLSNSEKPTVNLRSTNTIGQELSPTIKKETPSLWEKIKSWLPSALLMTAIVYILAVVFSRKSQKTEVTLSKNNAAFILIHNGFIAESGKILTSAIEDGDYSSYAFSNLALFKSLSGENEQALALLECAKYTPKGKHSIAVNHFNESIILFRNNDKNRALIALEKALNLSFKEITKYFEKSKHTEEMKEDETFQKSIKLINSKHQK